MYIALYARQSIDKENSVSIETQLEYCVSMVKPDEKQYQIKKFSDRGYSGKDTNRPGFKSLMKDIRRGKVKKLIVYKLDRVSRSLIDFVDMLQTFKEHSVEFVSSQEMFDTSSPYGEMIMKLLMIFAEFERTSIINRIRDAYDKRSNMGMYSGGRRVYGYDLVDATVHGIKTKKFVPNEREAEHIKYIFEVYSQPEVTLRRLQTNLLENGITPLYGEDWTTGKLGTLLRNPLYAKADADIYSYYKNRNVNIIGDLRDFDGSRHVQLYGQTHHDKNLPDWSDMKIVLLESEGIVSSDVWLKCQKKLEKNKQIGNSMSNHTSWLSGKLVCAKCRHTMTTVKGASKRYFVCAGKTHKKTCTGIKATVYVDDMENMVYECISEKLKALRLSRKKHSDETSAQINSLKIRIKEIESQQEKLTTAILDGSLNADIVQILNSKAKSLGDEKRKIVDKIEDLSTQTSHIADSISFSKKWSKANFNEKRAIANMLIKAILMYEDGTPEIIWNVEVFRL